jgi:hypothetical protein
MSSESQYEGLDSQVGVEKMIHCLQCCVLSHNTVAELGQFHARAAGQASLEQRLYHTEVKIRGYPDGRMGIHFSC